MEKKVSGLILRYFILIILVLGVFFLLDVFLASLTTKTAHYFINLFFESSIFKNFIISSEFIIEISVVCVGISAYVLLIALNLTTEMKLWKRILSLIFSLCSFFILNIVRIVFLVVILAKNPLIFDLLHKIFWIGFSSLIVAGIWILNVIIFKINKIPIVGDFKKLWNLVGNKKDMLK